MQIEVDDDVAVQVAQLATAHGLSVSATLARLLDRDPHEHEHRCPTCVRLAAIADGVDPDQPPLFLVG